MYTNDQHEQAPTANDLYGDTSIFPASVTADPAAWQAECDAAFGYDERQEPTPEEEEQHYAAYIASEMDRMNSDELCAVLRDSATPEEIKAAARVEAVRRINELMSATARKSA